MMSYCCALMYHALYETEEEYQALSPDEQPYAVSTTTFRKHLDIIQGHQLPILSLDAFAQQSEFSEPCVLITFDDGHKSFYEHALPILNEYQAAGVFFITPQYIQDEHNACTWDQVKALNKSPHYVGGHGMTHQFIGVLSAEAAEHELQTSLDTITQHITSSPISMSFPGGVYQASNIQQAQKAGYTLIFGSRCAVITTKTLQKYHAKPTTGLARVAIRANTSLDTLRAIVLHTPSFYYKQTVLDVTKQTIKRIIGANNYHKLYQWVAQHIVQRIQ